MRYIETKIKYSGESKDIVINVDKIAMILKRENDRCIIFIDTGVNVEALESKDAIMHKPILGFYTGDRLKAEYDLCEIRQELSELRDAFLDEFERRF